MKKGFLKPIRYISQMFDHKEPEMQIGFPTEVKHVAHIGFDGPSANSNPGWMNNYHSAPLSSVGTEAKVTPSPNLWGSQDLESMHVGIEETPSQQTPGPEETPSQQTPGPEEPASVPTRPRHSRRHKSDETSNNSADATASDALDSTRRSRKPRKKEAAAGTQEMPAIPKQSHRRKSKDSGGTGKASKPKAPSEDGSSKPSSTHGKSVAAEEE